MTSKKINRCQEGKIMKINWENFKNKADVIQYLKKKEEIPCTTTAQAEQYLQKYVPKEQYYQDKIIKHIKQLFPNAFVWKAAAGAYSRRGIPDVCAVIHGRYYGFEVKRPFLGVISDIQIHTMKQIRRAGGKAYVVSYINEVEKLLQEELETNKEDECHE